MLPGLEVDLDLIKKYKMLIALDREDRQNAFPRIELSKTIRHSFKVRVATFARICGAGVYSYTEGGYLDCTAGVVVEADMGRGF